MLLLCTHTHTTHTRHTTRTHTTHTHTQHTHNTHTHTHNTHNTHTTQTHTTGVINFIKFLLLVAGGASLEQEFSVVFTAPQFLPEDANAMMDVGDFSGGRPRSSVVDANAPALRPPYSPYARSSVYGISSCSNSATPPHHTPKPSLSVGSFGSLSSVGVASTSASAVAAAAGASTGEDGMWSALGAEEAEAKPPHHMPRSNSSMLADLSLISALQLLPGELIFIRREHTARTDLGSSRGSAVWSLPPFFFRHPIKYVNIPIFRTFMLHICVCWLIIVICNDG